MSENTLHLSLKKTEQYSRLPKIVVMGVGGGGCNAINNMMDKKIEGVEFVAVNTDVQSLVNSKAQKTIQLGRNTTKGQGAGTYPEVGRSSAEESKEEIEDALKDVELLFLTAGMGGGTGTGATPFIAKMAKEKNILTVAVVTKPFQYEAEARLQIAEEGIAELKKYVDTMIVLPNENLFRIANKETTLKDAFMCSDNVLYLGVRGITDLITTSGLMNLDFADVGMVIKKMGRAMMGMGEAEGENRAIKAVEEALSNPLLEDVNIKGATGALVNITGSPDMTLFEFDEAAKRIREEIGGDKVVIKVGAAFMKELEGKTGIVYGNSPTNTVGWKPISELKQIHHPIPLLSLDKQKDINKLVEFISKADSSLMYKLDGLTVRLDYENGELVAAGTRGDGDVGDDITHNIPAFANVPIKIGYKGRLSISGEAFIFRDKFEELNKQLPEDKRYKGPRNLAAGTVRAFDPELCRQ